MKNGALARRDVITYFTLAATTQMMRILVTGASSPLAVGVMRLLLLNSDLELWAGRHRKAIPLSDPRLHAIDLDLEKSDLTETLSRTPVDMVRRRVMARMGATVRRNKADTGDKVITAVRLARKAVATANRAVGASTPWSSKRTGSVADRRATNDPTSASRKIYPST